MTRLCVAPIVEGHGEDLSVRTLLDRIWRELLGGEYIHVLRPIRRPRSALIKPEGLQNAVRLACLKLREAVSPGDHALVLVLIDSDAEPPCLIGPSLQATAAGASAVDASVVLAHVEYETWFVAAAASLTGHLVIGLDEALPADPEGARSGKGWIMGHFRGARYSETIDQPSMTARMDLALCRSRSSSFDKLCRELEKRLAGSGSSTSS